MVEDVDLSPRDRMLYEKLHASHGDIGTAQSCAEFILKKGWHTYSFMRRGSVPIQQIAFITTMIVSYARPFSPGRGGSLTFPHRILQYRLKESLLHERLLKLRNQQYAHSDPSTISVRPLKGNIVTSIQSLRDVRFSRAELEIFVEMTNGVTSRIRERLEEIRLSGR